MFLMALQSRHKISRNNNKLHIIQPKELKGMTLHLNLLFHTSATVNVIRSGQTNNEIYFLHICTFLIVFFFLSNYYKQGKIKKVFVSYRIKNMLTHHQYPGEMRL